MTRMKLSGHLRVVLQDGAQHDLQLGEGVDVSHDARPGLTIGAWAMSDQHFRVFIHNTDAPIISATNRYSVPANPPVLLRSVGLAVPEGWTIVDHAQRLAHRVPDTHPEFDAWSLIGSQTPRPRHSAVPQAGGSAAAGFFLNGGHQIWWDVVAPGHDPYPLAPDSTDAHLARATLGINAPDLGSCPLDDALKPFWRFWGPDASRYSVDDWAIHRFGGRKPWQGPIDFGHLMWGEGHSQHHYDMIGHAVTAALYGVPGAWYVATRMALAKLQTGIYVTEHGRYAYMHTDEKTGGPGEYPGDSRVPHHSHEWDRGLIAWALLSGDRAALAIVKRRAEVFAARCESDPHMVWNGAGGARMLGWAMTNLDAMHRGGILDTTNAAEALMTHAVAKNTGQSEWRNVYTGSVGFAPWMQSLTNGAILDAMQPGGPLEPTASTWRPVVEPMVRWQCEHIVNARGVAPHWVADENDRTQDVWRYGVTQAAWAIPQLWHAVNTLGMSEFAPKLAAAKDRLILSGEKFDEYATGNGGGPGWLKTVSSWGVSGLRERFWA